MTELERALVLLGRELELPPTPQLRFRPARRRRWWVVAVALAAAIATAFAVPGSRAELLRFFHIRGAEVRIVDTLPPLPVRSDLGVPIGIGAADFRLLLLDGKPPEQVFAGQGGYWLRYPGVLLFEFDSGSGMFLKKVAGSARQVEYVQIGDRPGIWVGAKHGVYLPGGDARSAGHVLLWQYGDVTLRLEAKVDRARAIEVALRVR